MEEKEAEEEEEEEEDDDEGGYEEEHQEMYIADITQAHPTCTVLFIFILCPSLALAIVWKISVLL